MALPKVKHPTFNLKIPSNNKEVTFRPFSVQEEKLLLMAKDSKEEKEILNAVKQIINNCILDEVDVENLALFDVEYIILKLRAKSVGEMIELNYNFDGEEVPIEINLDDVEVKKNKNSKNKFMITEELGVKMRYPSVSMATSTSNMSNEDLFTLISSCIENVYDNDKIYDEFTITEMNDFVMSLPSSALAKLGEFFNNLPKVEHTLTIKNKEGKEKTVTLSGLSDFFTL